jgi:hypothetical protein
MEFVTHRPLWTTKEGATFPVDLMSDRHLDNAILMLRRQGWMIPEEIGPPPTDRRDRMVWAAHPISQKLTDLCREKVHRTFHDVPPKSEDEAQYQQARWMADQAPRRITRLRPGITFDDRQDDSQWMDV